MSSLPPVVYATATRSHSPASVYTSKTEAPILQRRASCAQNLLIIDNNLHICLQRKIGATRTGGSIRVGFVLDQGGQVVQNSQVRMVRVRMEQQQQQQQQQHPDDEFRILQHLHAHGIMDCLLAKDATTYYIVSEYSTQSLNLVQCPPDPHNIPRIVRLCLVALSALHQVSISLGGWTSLECWELHNDTIRLVDVRHTRTLDDPTRPTRSMAPELLGKESVVVDAVKLDVWALGTCLTSWAQRPVPVLRDMVQADPALRPSVAELLQRLEEQGAE